MVERSSANSEVYVFFFGGLRFLIYFSFLALLAKNKKTIDTFIRVFNNCSLKWLVVDINYKKAEQIENVTNREQSICFFFTARVNQFCCSPEAAAEKSLSLFKVSAMSSTFSFLSTSTVALFFRQ